MQQFFKLFFVILLFSSCGESFDRQYAEGLFLYQTHCKNCHGIEGEGLGNLVPPLTDSIYLRQNKAHLYDIIRNGLFEKIIVDNREFYSPMPKNSELTDEEIENVIIYVSNSFGNHIKE